MIPLKEKIKILEKEEIILALMECDGVQARAARKLGITERMIGYKIRKYNIILKEVGDDKGKKLEVISEKLQEISKDEPNQIRKGDKE